MKTFALGLLALMLVCACEREVGPALNISETVVYAPLPGTDAAVAYMTFTNRSGGDIVIDSISSPQYASVTLHETQIVDGIARMAILGSLPIPAQSLVRLAAGGKHIMLLQPTQDIDAGQSVTLLINYDGEGLLFVTATLQSRLGHESSD